MRTQRILGALAVLVITAGTAGTLALGAAGSAVAAAGSGAATHSAGTRLSPSSVNGPTNGGYYKFWQLYHGTRLCLTAGQTHKMVKPCAQGDSQQKWYDQPATNGHKLVQTSSDYCLTGEGNGNVTTPCAQGDGAQEWHFGSVTGTTTKVWQSDNGLRECLDSLGNTTPITRPCHQGTPSQKWNYEETSP